VFYIVDAFAIDADRSMHLGAEIARALMAGASDLFAEPPAIEKVEVFGAKLTETIAARSPTPTATATATATSTAHHLAALVPGRGDLCASEEGLALRAARGGT
jgi:hypothetical protein